MTRSTHTREYQELVQILIEARNAAGLTQQQVADRLGKPQSYIAKIEGAERRIDVVEFSMLAKAMDIDPIDLLRKLLVSSVFENTKSVIS